ncbi:MAG: DUF1007 family protein [Deltaproteobacteria bacterium]|nr:DUF1007 family protein [Deltaproteobacteria bacterium]
MSKKTTLIIASVISIILLSIFYGSAQSHPHVFIVQRIKIVFDDNGLAGFKIQWNFDDMFASMIAGDYDKNQNGTLEKNEIALIKKEAFSYLANYNYFTFIKNGKKPFTIKFTKNFSTTLKNNKLRYEFFVPFHVTATNNFKDITVAVYDPSYYSAIFFSTKNPVALDNSESFEVKTAIKEDKSTSIYYDMINPWALFLNFRIKQ